MINALLVALEQDPIRVFYERDLAVFPAAELEYAADRKFLRPVPRGSSYRDGTGRTLLLAENKDSTFDAIDTDDRGADPVSVDASDLARWRIDILRVADEARELNGLRGQPERMGDETIFVGHTSRAGRRVAVILGLFLDSRQAMERLLALPSLVPRYEAIIVACPSFALGPHESRMLQVIDIHLTSLGDDLRIDLDTAMAPPRRRSPQVILADDEEREVDLHGFKSRLPIHVTGRREARRANIVEVDGEHVSISDERFKLFMRLAVALYETRDGYVERGSMMTSSGLAAEGYYKPEGMEQATDRLRGPFRGALKGLNATDLIEVRSGMIRLSTHPRYISLDSEALLRHHDPTIRRLTKRLDSAARTRAGPS